MKAELVKKLIDRFPCINTENNIGLQWGSVCDIGDGWFKLIAELLEAIEDIYQNSNLSMEDDFTVTQIKEKYGTLRFYASSTLKEVQDLIDLYEAKSETVCEDCAKAGSLHVRSDYFLTLCEHCASKKGFEKVKKFRK